MRTITRAGLAMAASMTAAVAAAGAQEVVAPSSIATTEGRPSQRTFQLMMVTPTGDLGDVGGVGGGINFVWARTIAATQHTVGVRLDIPIAAGTAIDNQDQGWTFISPSLGVVVSPVRARLHVLPYAFAGVSYNRVSFLDLITDEELSETGVGSAFGAGVELPTGIGRISLELRVASVGLENWTASHTSFALGFVSGGIRPPRR